MVWWEFRKSLFQAILEGTGKRDESVADQERPEAQDGQFLIIELSSVSLFACDARYLQNGGRGQLNTDLDDSRCPEVKAE